MSSWALEGLPRLREERITCSNRRLIRQLAKNVHLHAQEVPEGTGLRAA